MRVHRVPGNAYDEVFASWQIPAGAGHPQLSDAVSRFASELGAIPVCATMFGSLTVDRPPSVDLPAICAGNQYPSCGEASYIEIRGIAPTGAVSVEPLPPGAVVIDSRGFRRLVCAVTRPVGDDITEQASAAMAQAAKVLASAGLHPRDIRRTWYFLSDINQDYAAFNRVRDAYFDEWELRDYPASTGIGAALPEGALINVLLEATDPTSIPIRTFDTRLQSPPVAYGPRFVRANELIYNGIRTVNISGISSVGPTGVSMRGSVEELAAYTVASFRDLLASTDMALDDIVSAYAYCKGDDVRDAFERTLHELGISFPVMINHVDICRSDLVLEIEAKALRVESGAPGP